MERLVLAGFLTILGISWQAVRPGNSAPSTESVVNRNGAWEERSVLNPYTGSSIAVEEKSLGNTYCVQELQVERGTGAITDGVNYLTRDDIIVDC